MLTRRVHGRVFLLRPSKRTNRIIGYVLAVISAKWGVKVHAVCALSNHWHVVLTDPNGKVVEFQRDCHQFIARALNVHHDEFESIWASDQTSRVECEEPDDVIERIAYTMANPVEAGLVRHGSSWPGLRRAWPSPPRTFKRPPKFFRGEDDGGVWPADATLVLERIPDYDELSDEELAAVIGAAIEQREDQFRAERDRDGKRFLGRAAVLAQSRHDRPRSPDTRSGISPKVGCRDKWRRIERLRCDKRWQCDYDSALNKWRAGDRDVVFPAGTYKMRVVHGARCADPPT